MSKLIKFISAWNFGGLCQRGWETGHMKMRVSVFFYFLRARRVLNDFRLAKEVSSTLRRGRSKSQEELVQY